MITQLEIDMDGWLGASISNQLLALMGSKLQVGGEVISFAVINLEVTT
jgi:hypothetical protein